MKIIGFLLLAVYQDGQWLNKPAVVAKIEVDPSELKLPFPAEGLRKTIVLAMPGNVVTGINKIHGMIIDEEENIDPALEGFCNKFGDIQQQQANVTIEVTIGTPQPPSVN